MKISNPKTETPNSIDLNDKDYMNMTLTYLKELIKNYAVALTEASNQNLFAKYLEQFKKIAKLQRDVYEEMFLNGWYELETVEQTKMQTKYNNLINDFNSLKS